MEKLSRSHSWVSPTTSEPCSVCSRVSGVWILGILHESVDLYSYQSPSIAQVPSNSDSWRNLAAQWMSTYLAYENPGVQSQQLSG